jgi:hypothetical protein
MTGNEPIVSKSGNANSDMAPTQTLIKLVDEFKVHPGGAFYDDGDPPNAFVRETKLEAGKGASFVDKERVRYKSHSGSAPIL